MTALNPLRWALLALAAATLPGCSPDESKPRVATTARALRPAAAPVAASHDPYAPLMRAVFGNDYLPAKGYAIAGGAAADVPDAELPLILTGTTSMQLPSGETAFVVEGSFRRPAGEEMMGEVEGSPVHLYLLRQQGGAWHVVRRHENIAEKSRNGTAMQWVTLAPGRPGLAIEDHWLGQGYTATWLSLYDPAAERVANLLGDTLMTRSDNEGACAEQCWSGEAKWRIVPGSGRGRNAPYDDLVLTITGEETVEPDGESDTDAAPGPASATSAAAEKRSLAGTARYAYRDGQYRLVEGENTLPTF